MRKRNLTLAVLGLLVAALWLNNSSLLAPRRAGEPTILAHRGVAQRFDARGVQSDTCTATRIVPPIGRYIENTLPAIRAAFAAGADIVEIDVHPTTDGRFAVFHDWTLDCRTDGAGRTRDHTLAELKRLDVGFGYTADGGRTFPFRGQGVGMMPSLEEVLAAFPGGRFNINFKGAEAAEGQALSQVLLRLPPERRAGIMVYGADAPVAAVRSRLPEVRSISRQTLLACLPRYIAIGWTGVTPRACRGATLLVPINVAPWLWGWPHRFLNRVERSGGEVFVIGPYRGGGFTSGIDTPEQLSKLPRGYAGGIWTDEIETIGPAVKRGF